jgi:hypothetical protein
MYLSIYLFIYLQLMMLMVIINQQAWQLTGKAWPWDNYFDLSQNFYPSLSVDWRFSWSQAWELQKKTQKSSSRGIHNFIHAYWGWFIIVIAYLFHYNPITIP